MDESDNKTHSCAPDARDYDSPEVTLVLDNEPTSNKRSICQQCERPKKVCWCDYLPTPKVLPTSGTSIMIIQHPSEKKRKIRTALMALYGLKGGYCEIFVRRKLSDSDPLCEKIKHLNAYLLYPSAASKDITTLASDDKEKTLIILDGTWDEAKKIYTRSSILQYLPTIHLELDKKSEYVVRTQPCKKCLSTIETVAHSLAILENNSIISEKLLHPLQMLCKFQLSHGAVEHDYKTIKTTNVNSRVLTEIGLS